MKKLGLILLMLTTLMFAASCGDEDLNFAGEMSLNAGTMTYDFAFDCEGIEYVKRDIKAELVKVEIFQKKTQEQKLKSLTLTEANTLKKEIKSAVWCTGIASFITGALPVAHKPEYKCKKTIQSVSREVLTQQICERFWGDNG